VPKIPLLKFFGLGLILSGLSLLGSVKFFYGFSSGFWMIFIIDLFFACRIFWFPPLSSERFLRRVFRAEMQKMVLFVLLLAIVLHYIRPDFLALLLGLLAAFVVGRFVIWIS